MNNNARIEERIASKLAERTESFAWRSFLQMLSVERTEPFLLELRLPIEPHENLGVIRFARACLEVYMAKATGPQSFPIEAREFCNYWSLYRREDGVLSEDLLRKYATRYEGAPDLLLELYAELQGWIGSEKSTELRDWFSEHFRPAYDGVGIWFEAFSWLLRDRSGRTEQALNAPISDEQWQILRECCDDYYTRKRSLAEKFQKLVQVAISDGPTVWEAVLQTFPVDSVAGFDYPWLGAIEKCLKLQLLRDKWCRLSERLGVDAMKEFEGWVVHWWARLDESQGDLPDPAIWLN